jgi:methyl-accepting chemotaxis protein
MTPIGDPARLRRLAAALSEMAETVRGHARQVDVRARTVQWESTAAEAFRESVEREVSRLLATAGGLDDASATLRAHARTVEQRIEELGRVERAAEHVLGHLGLHL